LSLFEQCFIKEFLTAQGMDDKQHFVMMEVGREKRQHQIDYYQKDVDAQYEFCREAVAKSDNANLKARFRKRGGPCKPSYTGTKYMVSTIMRALLKEAHQKGQLMVSLREAYQSSTLRQCSSSITRPLWQPDGAGRG
jgi:hypothetical protein